MITPVSNASKFEEHTTVQLWCISFTTRSSNGDDFYPVEQLSNIMWKLDGKRIYNNEKYKLINNVLQIEDLNRNDRITLRNLSCEISYKNNVILTSMQPFEVTIVCKYIRFLT